MNDFFRITGLDEDLFEDVAEEVETLAGMLLNIKHDFPHDNEILEYANCRFLVMGVERHRVKQVKVRILDTTQDKK